ncbi:MAG: DNA replication/repair protein RecF [Rhodanobacteraceae bacterium]|nr:DNA replication/repair protein RecF [Rhodanobacteraceae bacterium]
MELGVLRIANVRNVAAAEIVLCSGVNEFVGPNGAGKTSLLEATYMLSHGRSFRSVKRESLIRLGSGSLDVFTEVRRSGRVRRLGLSRTKSDWAARMDGREVLAIAELLREVAVVCFEPGSHALISGGAEERRHFVDWALFHVEHGYVDVARNYRRALRQRNALLRAGRGDAELDIWDAELVRNAVNLDKWRSNYLDKLSQLVNQLSVNFLPELGASSLSYVRGWGVGLELGEALRERRQRDRERGHTSAGPHRADWRLSFENAPEREHLSRGQEKLSAMICLLAQATLYEQQLGEWPILCLDDLASELDTDHQQRVLQWLEEVDAQVLVTGTSALPKPQLLRRQRAMFHVEQGSVVTLL